MSPHSNFLMIECLKVKIISASCWMSNKCTQLLVSEGFNPLYFNASPWQLHQRSLHQSGKQRQCQFNNNINRIILMNRGNEYDLVYTLQKLVFRTDVQTHLAREFNLNFS